MFVEAVKKAIVKLRQYAGRIPEDRLLLLLAIGISWHILSYKTLK